jgi:hypothetical protein
MGGRLAHVRNLRALCDAQSLQLHQRVLREKKKTTHTHTLRQKQSTVATRNPP